MLYILYPYQPSIVPLSQRTLPGPSRLAARGPPSPKLLPPCARRKGAKLRRNKRPPASRGGFGHHHNRLEHGTCWHTFPPRSGGRLPPKGAEHVGTYSPPETLHCAVSLFMLVKEQRPASPGESIGGQGPQSKGPPKHPLGSRGPRPPIVANCDQRSQWPCAGLPGPRCAFNQDMINSPSEQSNILSVYDASPANPSIFETMYAKTLVALRYTSHNSPETMVISP
jgi:hypothetical protein